MDRYTTQREAERSKLMSVQYSFTIAVTEDEGIVQASSQGGHWPGLDSALLDKLLLGSEEGLSGAVSSKKSSVAHCTVISARDAALRVSWEETAHVHMPTI